MVHRSASHAKSPDLWPGPVGLARPAVASVRSPARLAAQNDLLARARALHKQSPLIDGHNDYPWALRERDAGGDFDKADITEPRRR